MSKTKVNIVSGSHRPATIFAVILVQAISTLTHPALAQNKKTSPISMEASTSLEWDQIKGLYIATGDAILEQDDRSLRADDITAHYDPSSERRILTEVSANGSVVFIDGDNVARGERLDYRIADETYRLFGPKAIVTSPRGIITAIGSITYDASNTRNKQVLALGAASYRDDNGRVIEGEQVVAFLDEEGAIETVKAEGNARVVSPQGIVAAADRLDYVAATDRADLFGHVEIIDRDNILRGTRAEVEFDKEISRLLSDNTGQRVTGVLNP